MLLGFSLTKFHFIINLAAVQAYIYFMGIVFRQSIKSLIMTVIGISLGGLVTLLSMYFFPKNELGFTQNIIKICISFLGILGAAGMNYTLVIYGKKYTENHPKRSTFLSLSLYTTLIWTSLICLLLLLFKNSIIQFYGAEDSALMQDFFVLFPLFTFISSLNLWLEGYLYSIHKTAVLTFAKEVLARVIYVALIVLYGMNVLSFGQFIWWYVILYLIPLLFTLWIAKKNQGFKFSFSLKLFSRQEIIEVLRFANYQMLITVSLVLIIILDSIMLAPLDTDGFKSGAVYSIAFYIISMARSLSRSASAAVLPSFSQSYFEGNIKGLKEQYVRSAINLQLIAVVIITLALVNYHQIDTFIAYINTGYSMVDELMLILFIGLSVELMCGLSFEILGAANLQRFNLLLSLGFLVIMFGLNYWLIPKLGIYGAAWASSIGISLYNLAKTAIVYRYFKVLPFQVNTLKLVLLSLLIIGLLFLIPTFSSSLIDVLIRSLIAMILLTLGTYKLNISNEFNQLIRNLYFDKKMF